MNQSSESVISATQYKNLPLVLSLTAVIILWLVAFYQGLLTAIDVWQVSEIFTHCFLVIPCSFYFIYQKRHQLFASPWQPNYWLLPFFLGAIFVQLFGEVGDIQLFMHMATFTSLPLMIWMVVGNRAAKTIFFPLCFILFSIPVGEQLIPYLQLITTDMAVPLLELFNVPIFRNGFYLDIPQGRFLVAEACSGISFLIASVVFGCFYAYISFTKFSKQIAFVALSIFIPVFANALRVFGIVLTAHLTDMEYAAGADHIIYGGVFYCIILFILIAIGEKFRDKSVTTEDKNKSGGLWLALESSQKMLVLIIVAIVLQLIWLSSVNRITIDNNRVDGNAADKIFNRQNLTLEHRTFDSEAYHESNWQPNYKNASDTLRGQFNDNKQIVDFYAATYLPNQGELISSLNTLFDNRRWSQLSQERHFVNALNADVVITKLVSPTGGYRFVAHWYQLSSEIFTSQIKVKLLQTKASLFAAQTQGSVIALSISPLESAQGTQALLKLLNAHANQLTTLVD